MYLSHRKAKYRKQFPDKYRKNKWGRYVSIRKSQLARKSAMNNIRNSPYFGKPPGNRYQQK